MTQRLEGNSLLTSSSTLSSTSSDHKSSAMSSKHHDSSRLHSNLIMSSSNERETSSTSSLSSSSSSSSSSSHQQHLDKNHLHSHAHTHGNHVPRDSINSNHKSNNKVTGNHINHINGHGQGSSSHSSTSFITSSVNVTGGPLSYTYTLHSIHLHFGTNDLKGSEHTIEGIAFPGEVSCFHHFHLLQLQLWSLRRSSEGEKEKSSEKK